LHDDALLAEFFVDTQSHLDGIEEIALGLDKDPAQTDLIDDVFRRVHSVKGNAGMLGFTAIHTEGQEFETFLDGVRAKGTATPEEVERIFDYNDKLKAAVNSLRAEKGMPVDSQITASEEPSDQEPAEEPDQPPEPAGAPDTKPETQAPPVPSATTPTAKPEKAKNKKTEPQQNGKVTFLTFDLADEKYGVDIIKVREIIIKEAITRVPNTKPFVKGVMNLRDQVIPVFDLKRKLGIPPGEKSAGEGKNIVIIEISRVATGLIVDEVTGIRSFDKSHVASPENFYGSIPSEFLHGIAKTETETIILLEVMDLCDPTENLY